MKRRSAIWRVRGEALEAAAQACEQVVLLGAIRRPAIEVPQRGVGEQGLDGGEIALGQAGQAGQLAAQEVARDALEPAGEGAARLVLADAFEGGDQGGLDQLVHHLGRWRVEGQEARQLRVEFDHQAGEGRAIAILGGDDQGVDALRGHGRHCIAGAAGCQSAALGRGAEGIHHG